MHLQSKQPPDLPDKAWGSREPRGCQALVVLSASKRAQLSAHTERGEHRDAPRHRMRRRESVPGCPSSVFALTRTVSETHGTSEAMESSSTQNGSRLRGADPRAGRISNIELVRCPVADATPGVCASPKAAPSMARSSLPKAGSAPIQDAPTLTRERFVLCSHSIPGPSALKHFFGGIRRTEAHHQERATPGFTDEHFKRVDAINLALPLTTVARVRCRSSRRRFRRFASSSDVFGSCGAGLPSRRGSARARSPLRRARLYLH